MSKDAYTLIINKECTMDKTDCINSLMKSFFMQIDCEEGFVGIFDLEPFVRLQKLGIIVQSFEISDDIGEIVIAVYSIGHKTKLFAFDHNMNDQEEPRLVATAIVDMANDLGYTPESLADRLFNQRSKKVQKMLEKPWYG